MPAAVLRLVASRGAERVDRLICDETGYGRRVVRRWLKEGRVRVNGHVATGSDPVGAGSEILIDESGPVYRQATAALAIVLETDELIAVAKPAGMHTERGRSAGSLAELLEQRYGNLSEVGQRPAEAGLVHRLDRDTSGVLVVARTREVYDELRLAFDRGDTTKEYLALVGGRLAGPTEIAMPLARRGAHVAIAGLHDRAIEAVTWVEPLETGRGWSLVLATMHTGAMHQVRCHLSAIGHPLFGDSLYGGSVLDVCAREGQLLHAMRVRIADRIDVTVGPPADFLEAYAALRRCER